MGNCHPDKEDIKDETIEYSKNKIDLKKLKKRDRLFHKGGD